MHKIMRIKVVLVALFGVLLLPTWSLAEELSDFEKLLQEAIRNNQAGNQAAATERKAAGPAKTSPAQSEPIQSEPGKLVPSPKSLPSSSSAQNERSQNERAKRAWSLAKTEANPPKLQQIVAGGGWTAVVPHEAENESAALDDEPRVAGRNRPQKSREAVWDDEPKTISSDDAPTETVASTLPTMLPDALPETQPEEPVKLNVAKEEDTNKGDKEPAADPFLSGPKLVAPEPKQAASKVVESTAESKKTDSDAANPKEPNNVTRVPLDKEEPGRMEDILNSLARESKEKPKTEKTSQEQDKPAQEKIAEKVVQDTPKAAYENKDKKTTEKKPDEKKQSEAVATVEMKPEPKFPAFDADGDETKWKLIDPDRVGDPHAKDKIRLMYDEIINGLRTRNMSGRYEMWKNYAKSTLRNTAGLNTGSELDGRSRLNWYKNLFADPIKSVHEVSEFSRKIHHGLSGSHRHVTETMALVREKMDVPARNDGGVRFVECKTALDAVNELKRCLLEAQMAHARAIATLSPAELTELERTLVPTFAGPGCVNGHTIPNRSVGRRLVNYLEKIDKAAMYDAAEALLPLTNPTLLALLEKMPEEATQTSMLHGQKVQRISTSAGDIIIGGRESNTYDLDAQDMRDVVCVVDLGGNDTYRDGTCNLRRPVMVILDIKGNDTYVGTKPGIQGGSVLGVSLLVDAEGNDTYSAGDLCQGSTIGGAGMLFDFAGNDSYKALRRTQGHALCGLGILVDRKGTDKYRAALWAQGFGAPGGFGALEDVEGNDHYFCGGIYIDSYPEHPGYDGWGQGIGAGIRQVANGGIGMILDGAGNDVYEVDYFGHGGGYWLGVGIAQDFGGNDIRHGTTKSMYNGGPRQQSEWTRFANGFGCHYALGYVFDDEGDDVYGGRIMGTGMAWDLSIGFLCDYNGTDRFMATGGMTQGVGAEGSIGILYTYGGDDTFMGRNQAYASGGITYHSPSNCGSNFSFLVNYGGNDKYGSGARNNSYVQRGTQGGFLIDRPTDREAAGELAKTKELIEQREKEIAEYDEMVKKGREEAAARGRSYRPRTRRPLPISADQLNRLGSVPHFDSITRTGATRTTMK